MSVHASADRRPLPSDLSPEELVHELLSEGLMDIAASLASKLGLDMSNVFVELTKKCLALETLEHTNLAQDRTGLIITDYPIRSRPGQRNPGIPARALSKATKAWSLLWTYLDKYDTTDTNYQYRIKVAEEILQSSESATLPFWLVYGKIQGGPRTRMSLLLPLLRLMLRYNLLKEACELTITTLKEEGKEGISQKPAESESGEDILAALTSEKFGRKMVTADDGISGKSSLVAEDSCWVPWGFVEELTSELDSVLKNACEDHTTSQAVLAERKKLAERLRKELLDATQNLRYR